MYRYALPLKNVQHLYLYDNVARTYNPKKIRLAEVGIKKGTNNKST